MTCKIIGVFLDPTGIQCKKKRGSTRVKHNFIVLVEDFIYFKHGSFFISTHFRRLNLVQYGPSNTSQVCELLKCPLFEL